MFWPLLLFVSVGAFTPGPNNVLSLSIASVHGYRRTLPFIFGVIVGFPLLVLLCGVGLGIIFLSFEPARIVLKIVASLYLLYLAWRIATANTAIEARKTEPLRFWQGVGLQFINPKGWVFASGLVSLYIDPQQSYGGQIALMTLVTAGVGFCSASSWALFGTGLMRLLHSPRARRLFQIANGVLLVATVVGILIWTPGTGRT